MQNNYNITEEVLNRYIGFVYVTVNKNNGRTYIGQKHFDNSWLEYLGSGKILKQAIDKYGEESFYKIIVGFAKTEEELNNLEKEIIEINDAPHNKNFYNIADGGHGGNTFSGYTEEEFKIYCNSLRGENNPYYGHKHSEEVKTKMAEKRKSRIYKPCSDEVKKILSEKAKKRFEERKNHPSSKQYDIHYVDGTIKHFDSFVEMRKELKIQKRDYYRWKKYDIPKYKTKEKWEMFLSIDEIYENGQLSYKNKIKA